jgi:hypothetical protein
VALIEKEKGNEKLTQMKNEKENVRKNVFSSSPTLIQ